MINLVGYLRAIPLEVPVITLRFVTIATNLGILNIYILNSQPSSMKEGCNLILALKRLIFKEISLDKVSSLVGNPNKISRNQDDPSKRNPQDLTNLPNSHFNNL